MASEEDRLLQYFKNSGMPDMTEEQAVSVAVRVAGTVGRYLSEYANLKAPNFTGKDVSDKMSGPTTLST